MKLKSAAEILCVVLMLSACAAIPPGPSVLVMPGNGKPFEAFQADDSVFI
jgi:starvation-inducible outer membrane lipoprotein